MMAKRLFVLLLSAIPLVACTKKQAEPEPEPQKPAAEKPADAPGSSASSAGAKGPSSDVAYDVPAGWERVANTNAMRKATFKIKRADGDSDDAELTVTQVGGSIEENIKRWSQQFDQKTVTKRQQRTVGAFKVDVVEVHGTYLGMNMPGSPPTEKDKYAMLGAVIDTKPVTTFFKMIGPEKTIVAAQADFNKFVDSIHPK